MCEGLILEGSVIVRLLLGSRGLDKKARQNLDDDLFVFVVELLPQALLRNRYVDKAQMQLWHGSPGLLPMLSGHPPTGATERQRDCEDRVSAGASPAIPRLAK